MLNLSPNNISRRKSCVAAVFLITGQIDSLLEIPFLSFFLLLSMKAIKKVKSKSGDLILRKIGGLILLVTQNCEKMINFAVEYSI